MKKFLLAVAALTIGSVAGAQTQQWEGQNGTLRFLGCYTGQESVQCDITYTLTKSASATINLDPNDLTYYTSDGTSANAGAISLAGGPLSGGSQANVLNGIPVKATFVLPVPSGTRSLAALVISGHRINNVSISSNGAPDMTAVAAPKPSAPPPVAVPNNGGIPGGFSIRLSNCKVASGTYTCTATLTPVR